MISEAALLLVAKEVGTWLPIVEAAVKSGSTLLTIINGAYNGTITDEELSVIIEQRNKDIDELTNAINIAKPKV